MEAPFERLAGVADAKMAELQLESRSALWRHFKREFEKGGVGINLLISNCNGNRPISRTAAVTYSKVFGRQPGWYLYGDVTLEALLEMAAMLPAESRQELADRVAAMPDVSSPPSEHSR